MELDGIDSRSKNHGSQEPACAEALGLEERKGTDERDKGKLQYLISFAVIDLRDSWRPTTNELDARFHEVILWSSRTMLQFLRKRFYLKDIDKQRSESSIHLTLSLSLVIFLEHAWLSYHFARYSSLYYHLTHFPRSILTSSQHA